MRATLLSLHTLRLTWTALAQWYLPFRHNSYHLDPVICLSNCPNIFQPASIFPLLHVRRPAAAMTTTTAVPASAPVTIGVLLGSLREGGNNAGLAKWVSTVAQRALADSASATADYTIHQIFPFVPPTTATDSTPPTAAYPGPVIDPYIPQAVKSSADYPTPLIQRWSNTVSSCAAFLIVSPQYNWGVPGELKNAIDHLFHEWCGKPAVVVTYGGHGGGKCGDALRIVLQGALKMAVVEHKVEISLPRDYITGARRVGDGQDDTFLEQYESAVTDAVHELAGKLQTVAGISEASGKAVARKH